MMASEESIGNTENTWDTGDTGDTRSIIEGVEYTVIHDNIEPALDEKGDAVVEVDAVSEYARALQTFGAERFDKMAALDVIILGWLDAKRGRSGSLRTWRTYADILASFRAALQQEGLDLDGPVTPIALVAQAWAGSKIEAKGAKGAKGAKATSQAGVIVGIAQDKRTSSTSSSASSSNPAPATYNQRLASVSSFYKYARKQGVLQNNPIERVERRRVQAYSGSRALEAEYVKRALASIDRSTPIGMRDYALLLTYLQTGRRLSEVAALECRDLEQLPGGKLRVTFRRCKGGKVLYDTLTPHVSAALLAYLYNRYGSDIDGKESNRGNVLDKLEGEVPVWVSLAERNGTRGGRLSKVSISRICKARLGTTRVHTLRSTMAQVMEKKGAPVSLIQQRLAHSSLATCRVRKLCPGLSTLTILAFSPLLLLNSRPALMNHTSYLTTPSQTWLQLYYSILVANGDTATYACTNAAPTPFFAPRSFLHLSRLRSPKRHRDPPAPPAAPYLAT